MSIKIKLIIYFLVIFILFLGTSIFSVYKNYSSDLLFKKEISDSIQQIDALAKQSTIAQLIRYDDEVLTQSARNYAFTGDRKWRDRYFEFIPKLDLRISEALNLSDEIDKKIFIDISVANSALIKFEEEAINLADKKDFSGSQKILDSKEYYDQKTIYKKGIDDYILRHGISLDTIDPVSTNFIKNSEVYFSNNAEKGNYLILGLALLFLLMIIFLFGIIIIVFMRPLIIFKKTAKEIIDGNLEVKVNIKSKDEIGEFANDFNKMTKNLKDSIQGVEKKVIEKTKDLSEAKTNLEKVLLESSRMNKLMVGRELEMIKLKKEILNLRKNT